MLHSEKETIARGDKGNAALREIAGRLKALSYRDMTTFADMLGLEICGDGHEGFADAILKIADQLETA